MRSVDLFAAETSGEFGPELFRFLEELRANNQREWFNANKHRRQRRRAGGRQPEARLVRFLTAALDLEF